MTTGSKPAPYRVPVSFRKKKGLIVLDQMRSIDKTRLISKLGAVTEKTLAETLSTLQEIFTE